MSNVRDDDRKRGVVAYSLTVKECPVTGKLTNMIFRRDPDGRMVQAFNQAAADATYEDKE